MDARRPQRLSETEIIVDDGSPVEDFNEEAQRRDKFFNVKFGSHVKTEDSGLLCSMKNKVTKTWNLKKIVWANTLDHGDYMDARIHSANGICKEATFEDVRQNLRNDNKIKWADLKMSEAEIRKRFEKIRVNAMNNEQSFGGSLTKLLSQFQCLANLEDNDAINQQFFVGAGFTSRFDKKNDPGKGLPTAIPGKCDFVIPSAFLTNGKYTATVELKLRRKGTSLKIEDHDCWSCQTWSSGVGANDLWL